MSADTLLSSLDKVRRAAPGRWNACCPAHDDRSPSLSITEKDDGKVLMRCHAGCTNQQVLDAVGLGFEVLFPDKTANTPSRRPLHYPAADVLASLEVEFLVVAIAASDMAKGKPMAKSTRSRLWVAVKRVQSAMEVANGRRG